MGSFSDSVNKNCQKILDKIDKKCYAITYDLYNSIVTSTPVKNGYLINNWFPLAGGGFSSETTSAPSSTGTDSLSRILGLANSKEFFGKDGTFTMTNNLDYAYRVEYLGWSHFKAPAGMVRVNLVRAAAENR